MRRVLPRSLLGQMLLAVAIALLVAQTISAVLLYRAQEQRREFGVLNGAAFSLAVDVRNPDSEAETLRERRHRKGRGERSFWLERGVSEVLLPGERRLPAREETLRHLLADQNILPSGLVVTARRIGEDPYAVAWINERPAFRNRKDTFGRLMLVAAMQREEGGDWVVARVPYPDAEPRALSGIIGQTLILYFVLVGGLALLLRRITRPLALLTKRVQRFSGARLPEEPLEPIGPADTRQLIVAHNQMEARIAALLDEKDVMLGAIGHDLKTPLAALRVRIESVEDEGERGRMAKTIEDITATLDDILSLARVGRPSDPLEPVELGALTASVVEEFEDMEDPVELGETQRLVTQARATWLKRAMRNLVANAVRYGGVARVSLRRENGQAVFAVEDDGAGIPEAEIARMQEPFTRGDPSRSKGTGGAGLGLTLARAIAEQHGGQLVLANRKDKSGKTAGLTAELRLRLD